MAPTTGRGSEKGQQAQGASSYMPLEQDVAQGHSNQSPGRTSSYLNLDQGDAPNVSMDHPETQASDEPKPRKGQGRNKMPVGRYVITRLSDAGVPIEPIQAVNKFKTACGVVIRDHIPIVFRVWSSHAEDPAHLIPDDLKQSCWEKITERFQLPEGSEEVAKASALTNMAQLFRKFKSILNKDYVQKCLTLDFEHEFQNQQALWDDFVAFKRSEDATKVTETNKA